MKSTSKIAVEEQELSYHLRRRCQPFQVCHDTRGSRRCTDVLTRAKTSECKVDKERELLYIGSLHEDHISYETKKKECKIEFDNELYKHSNELSLLLSQRMVYCLPISVTVWRIFQAHLLQNSIDLLLIKVELCQLTPDALLLNNVGHERPSARR